MSWEEYFADNDIGAVSSKPVQEQNPVEEDVALVEESYCSGFGIMVIIAYISLSILVVGQCIMYKKCCFADSSNSTGTLFPH